MFKGPFSGGSHPENKKPGNKREEIENQERFEPGDVVWFLERGDVSEVDENGMLTVTFRNAVTGSLKGARREEINPETDYYEANENERLGRDTPVIYVPRQGVIEGTERGHAAVNLMNGNGELLNQQIVSLKELEKRNPDPKSKSEWETEMQNKVFERYPVLKSNESHPAASWRGITFVSSLCRQKALVVIYAVRCIHFLVV